MAENLVRINKEYLKSIALRANVTLKEMSTSIGRNDAYISKSLYKGEMRDYAAALICRVYGADIEKLVIKEEPKAEVKTAKAEQPTAETLARIEKKIDFLISQLT